LVLTDHFHDEQNPDEETLDFIHRDRRDFSAGVAENIITQKQLSKILAAEIGLLSPVFKTLIGLYHHEELSYEEISDITGLPQGTVKSYLFRARKLLKENILSKYKREEL